MRKRMTMYLIEVIPITRLPRSLPDTFSYFSTTPINPGVAVEMRIQTRKLIGVVLRTSAVKDVKQELRRAPFTLRRIERILSPTPILGARDLEVLFQLSQYYLTSPAAILRLMIPAPLAKSKIVASFAPRLEINNTAPVSSEVIVGSARESIYEKAIQNCIEDKRQALVVMPEIIQAEKFYQETAERFPGKAFLITSKISEKMLRTAWLSIRAGDPAIVMGTHRALFLPFTNLGLVIIDDDGSPYHKSWDQEPRYHNREVAKILQNLHGTHLILGGFPPSLDAYEQAKENPVTKLTVLPAMGPQPLSLFSDMQKEMKEAGTFVTISQVVKDKLRSVVHEKGRAFLFVNRKGFAPFILCQECGEAFRCTNCSVPLVYHAQESLAEPTLLCHHCSAKQAAPDVCAHCGSHRLKPYGIGVERVVREIKSLFPKTPVFALEADENHREVKESLAAKLEKTSSYIAVGTEYAISGPILPRGEMAAIISVDTALHLPDFLQNERLFRVLTLVRRLAEKHFILQSYAKEPELLYDLFHGTFEHFAEKELKERRRFCYPPFGELIKLTIADTRRDLALERVKRLRLSLDAIERKHGDAAEITNPYPAYIEKKRGQFVFHVLVKIIRREDSALIKQTLRALLPPEVLVDVGPNTLL